MKEDMEKCPDFDRWLKDECLHEIDEICNNNDKPCPYLAQGRPFSLRQQELKDWQERNFPPSLYDDLNRDQLVERIRILELSIGMSEEVGELSHIILKASQKIREGISGKIDKDLVADGFADTVIYGTQLLSKLGIDAEEAIRNTTNSVLKRDWANNRKDADKDEHLPKTKKTVTLAYNEDCFGISQVGEMHPADRVRLLGIRYSKAATDPRNSRLIFYGCENVPDNLPKYLSILE